MGSLIYQNDQQEYYYLSWDEAEGYYELLPLYQTTTWRISAETQRHELLMTTENSWPDVTDVLLIGKKYLGAEPIQGNSLPSDLSPVVDADKTIGVEWIGQDNDGRYAYVWTESQWRLYKFRHEGNTPLSVL